MDEKRALEILLKMLNKLEGEEKEAVLSAIGLLDTAVIAKKIIRKRVENQKAKKKEWGL